MKRVLIANPTDNVANAIADINIGDDFAYVVEGRTIQLKALEEIPFGFKAAVRDIPTGGAITKYDQVIGKASRAIRAGECVHIHNVEGTRGRGDKGGN